MNLFKKYKFVLHKISQFNFERIRKYKLLFSDELLIDYDNENDIYRITLNSGYTDCIFIHKGRQKEQVKFIKNLRKVTKKFIKQSPGTSYEKMYDKMKNDNFADDLRKLEKKQREGKKDAERTWLQS